MKKNMLAIYSALVAAFIFTAPISAIGEMSNSYSDIDGAPVYGDFVTDSDLASTIMRKEALAKNYIVRKMSTRAASESVTCDIEQVPQDENYYCGYASLKSLLDYEGDSTFTQSELETMTWQNYSSNGGALPWYWIDGSTSSQFPAVTILNEYIDYDYAPFPYGAAGATTPEVYEIRDRVAYALDNNHGVMAAGTSKSSTSDASHLPGYPSNANIRHWIVIYGYTDYCSNVLVADPAKSSAISWSGQISATYSISDSTLTAFVQSKGIIW